jgi:hypothetical protein
LPLHLHDAEAAMTGPAAVEIVLSERERGELEAQVRRRKIADAMRAEIVLLAADGLNNCAITDEKATNRYYPCNVRYYSRGGHFAAKH